MLRSGASYMICEVGWPVTSVTLPVTRDNSVTECIFSTTSAQRRRGGNEDVLNESTPQCSTEDVSGSGANS